MNKKLRLAIIDMDNLYNPFWAAGQARATREVGKRLAKKYAVTVYSSKYPGYRDYMEDGIMYTHIGIVSKSPRITNIGFILSIPFIVRKLKADIIIENFNAPFSVSLSPLFTKIPIIGLPTMFAAKEFSKKYHIPFHWIESFGCKWYKYFLPYSDIDSAKIKRLNKKIVYKIVPQGVDHTFFKIKHKKPEYILFLGRYDIEQKGIDLLLKAYARVAKQIQYPLILAGHGPDEKKIRKLLKELGIENNVQIVGPTYGKKKEEIIAKSLFVAFPSRHDELSLWALEALASGMPLVAFDLPESQWVAGNVVLKARPFDIDEYASLLLRATNKKVHAVMRRNARLFARKFTWDKVARSFDAFISHVIAREMELANE